MSLSLDDIYRLLADKQPVVLTAGLFQGLTDTLAYLGVAELQIHRDAPPVKASGKVTLDGRADALGLKGVATRLEVTGDDAHQVKLTFSLPASWQFPASFPKLPPSYKSVDDNPGLVSLQPSILGDLRFRNPTLVVQSAAEGERAAGLHFTGDLTDNAAFKNLAGPLKLGPAPTLAGTVKLNGSKAPDVCLSLAAGVSTLKVGSWLELAGVEVNVLTTPAPEDESKIITLVEVAGTVLIGKKEPVPVRIKSPVYGLSPIFGFAVELPPDVVSIKRGIDALVESAGGRKDEFALPKGIKLLESLYLREVSTDVDPTVPYVRHLQFAVESDRPWPITEHIQLTRLRFGWLILFPFDSAVRSVSAGVYGQLSLGTGGDAVRFDVTAYSHGGFTFSGALHEGDTIHLGRLVAQALGRKADGLPQLDLTKLGVTFDTNTSEFTFEAASSFEFVKDKHAALGLYVHLAKANEAYQATVKGSLVIAGQVFEAVFDSTGTSKSVLFEWKDTGRPLGFEEIAKFFGYTMAPLPESLDLTLAGAGFYYDFTSKTFVVSAQSKKGRQILFASPEPSDGKRLYLFDLDVPLKLALKDLPVIGDKLPPGLQFGIENLQVIVASANIDIGHLKALNSLITDKLGDRGLIPAKLSAGLTFAAMLRAGAGLPLPIVVPLSDGRPAPPPLPRALTAPGGQGNTPDYQAAAVWLPVAKTFGPVTLDRIGVRYEDGGLFFLLDASLVFSGLKLEMNGLGVGSPLKEVRLVPHLDGVSLSFSGGPLTMSGGLLRVPTDLLPKRPPPEDVAFEYIGAVTIEAEPYLIGGMASYARVGGQSSFFLFAEVAGQFGGPPAFFITGVMGGFGYGSALELPAPDQIHLFPFIAGLNDPNVFGPARPQPLDVMSVLAGGGGKKPWVTPAAGESWIAGGLRFRSFELVDGRVLLVVKLGKQFSVALYGLATMSLPQGSIEEAYAYVELQMEAAFKPSEGFFGIDASLTQNSYLLMRDCHLTGGFAFWMWFAGDDPASAERAGDFVVSVGGYHPAFVPPKWYPKLARVGFNWPVSTEVTIKGGVYMALTPTAIMAGGNLEAVYQSGNLRAWFTAYANMLIRWKPFYFTASIGISVGASYRLTLGSLSTTLSVELGATLDLWGPPTGGVVRLHWYILSFSVPFGARPKEGGALSLDWKGFGSLLPSAPAPHAPNPMLRETAGGSAAAVLGIQVNRGLVRTEERSGVWVVRADEFVFTVESAVPATSILLGNQALDLGGAPKTIDIRPMNAANVTSTQTVKVTKLSDPNHHIDWAPAVQRRNLPEALWGKPLGEDRPRPTANTIPNLPVGVTLAAPPAREGASPGVMEVASLLDPLPQGALPLSPTAHADANPTAPEEPGSSDGLAAGEVQLIDNFTPGLKDGEYKIELTQAVTAPGATINPVERRFSVQGPRFALDPSDIHACFPPRGASGQFERTLPQVILTKRLLPWERQLPAVKESGAPWLALLVFQQGETIDFQVEGAPDDPEAATKQAIANGAQTMTVQKLLSAENVRTPKLEQKPSDEEMGMNCQAIRISRDTFVNIVPTAKELCRLAHVRKVNIRDKAPTGMKDEGSFSVVVANRFPAAGAGAKGARNVAHLVSLEGFGDLLGGDVPAAPAEAQVQLVSLASWTFSCVEDPSQTFAGLVHALAYDGANRRSAESLLLGAGATNGYVELAHHAQTGEVGKARFRGPLSPVVVKPLQKSGPFRTAAEAAQQGASADVADLSLAAAWQLGRSLALADEAFTLALTRVRKRARSTLGRLAVGGTAQDRFGELAALFKGGMAERILGASKADQLLPLTPAHRARAATPRPADSLRALVAHPSFHAALNEEMKDDSDALAVAKWLGQLRLLVGVPFVHLVPDARMLPAGSIRFFYVDPNWLGALTDGALSIGIGTGQDASIHPVIHPIIAGGTGKMAFVVAPLTSGLLLRSPVVSGFRGLQVTATLRGARVAPLRIDHLAADVLLCLFNGVPDKVTLTKPQEGIELGVDDDGQVTTRVVKQKQVTAGAKVSVFDPRNPGAGSNVVRPGGLRVLDIGKLLGALEEKAGAGASGSSGFALQMLRGAEQIDFSRNP